MPKFGVFFGSQVGSFTTSTSLKTLLRMASAAKKKVEIVELRATGAGSIAPADIQHAFVLNGLTGAGAGTTTAQTPELFDQGGAAANSTCGVNASAEPTTYGSVAPVSFGFNQRGGDRWAVPRGEGFMFDNADTQLNAGVRVQSSSAGNVDGDAHFWEP